MKVGVLLLTFNEEVNLPRCLAALAWCTEIVLVDSGSTDKTVDIATAAGVRVLTRPFDNFANQRNFGLENGEFQNEWVLHLDADEVLTDQFVSELQKLSVIDGVEAWRVPSKTMLFGKWIKHAGMYPTYQVRLGHRDRLKFAQVGHGQREVLESYQIGVFPEPYLHYSFSHGMTAWLKKHIRYAEDEAKVLIEQRKVQPSFAELLNKNETVRRRAAKNMAAFLPPFLRPFARFFYVFIVRCGFRDGRVGLAYAIMMSVYEGMIAIFTYQQDLGGRQAVGKRRDKPDLPTSIGPQTKSGKQN